MIINLGSVIGFRVGLAVKKQRYLHLTKLLAIRIVHMITSFGLLGSFID